MPHSRAYTKMGLGPEWAGFWYFETSDLKRFEQYALFRTANETGIQSAISNATYAALHQDLIARHAAKQFAERLAPFGTAPDPTIAYGSEEGA